MVGCWEGHKAAPCVYDYFEPEFGVRYPLAVAFDECSSSQPAQKPCSEQCRNLLFFSRKLSATFLPTNTCF